MSKPQDRMIYRRSNGNWLNKRNDTSRASSVPKTQKEAENNAGQMLKKSRWWRTDNKRIGC